MPKLPLDYGSWLARNRMNRTPDADQIRHPSHHQSEPADTPRQDPISSYIKRATVQVERAALATEMIQDIKGSPKMSFADRLAEKLKTVAVSSPAMATTIEARADSFIARKDAIEARTETTFAPHEFLLATAESGLDAIGNALSILSNGGPPLDVSEGS